MGLINKTLKLAQKATNVVTDTAVKKLTEAKQKREEKERQFIAKFPYKYRYILRQKDSVSIDLILWDALERDSYVIYNSNEEPVYIAKGTMMMGKHHFIVTNPEKKVLGKVNKALFNVPIPFMKERKTCSIELPDQNPFEMETCISFNEREYTISNGMSIKSDNREREFQIYNKTSPKPIIHIYKICSGDGFFSDKYFVGFDEETYKTLALLLTIGIDTIRFGED